MCPNELAKAEGKRQKAKDKGQGQKAKGKRHEAKGRYSREEATAKAKAKGWQEATASKDPLVKRSKYIGVSRADKVYPKGLAGGECIQRPPGKEVQIHRGFKGQQVVSQGVGKGRVHPKTPW